MPDKRRHERVNFLSTAWLEYNGDKHFCRLANISISGAMMIMHKPICPPIPIGNRCGVTLYHDYDGLFSEEFNAQIAYCKVPSFGVEFLDMDSKAQEILKSIVNKEKCFLNSARTIVNMAREIAVSKGIELTSVHFDNGELNLEREIHCLRFNAGEHKIMVHLNRDEIEQFHGQGIADKKIRNTVDKLNLLLAQ